VGVAGGRLDTGNHSGQSIDVVDVRLLCPARDTDEVAADQPQNSGQSQVIAARRVLSRLGDVVGHSAQPRSELRDAFGVQIQICQLVFPPLRLLLLGRRAGCPGSRGTILMVMQTHVVDHPLAAALLTTMRDARSENATFRSALRRLTHMLVYEAMRDAEVEEFPVDTPVAATTGIRLAKPPLLVPVLRAGLGMVEQASALIPSAGVGFVGMARDEETHQPVPYLESLPADLSGIPVFVLDPMLATGGSMVHTIDLLVARGATDVTAVCVVAAPAGVDALAASGHPVRLVIASIDDGLDENAFIVPGLGDAGDRQFGPR